MTKLVDVQTVNVTMHCGLGYRFLAEPDGVGVVDEVIKDDCYRIEDIPIGSTVVDVGANIGAFSVFCAKERRCLVYAFEPNARSFSLLLHNAQQNGVADRIVPFKVAIDGLAGLRQFKSREDHPAGSAFVDCLSPETKGDVVTVPCLALRDVIPDVNCSPKEGVILKLDCEGAEKAIFADRASWVTMVARVVMEWHCHDGWWFAERLQEDGFETFLCGGGPPPRPAYDRSIGGGLLYAWRR